MHPAIESVQDSDYGIGEKLSDGQDAPTSANDGEKRKALESAPVDLSKESAAHLTIQENREHGEIRSEIDWSLYAPPDVYDRHPPFLHKFNEGNAPHRDRRQIPVRELFKSTYLLITPPR